METCKSPILTTHYKYAKLCKRIYQLPYNAKNVRLRDKHALVVIEGTDDLRNWRDNVKFLFRNKYDIHRGFFRYANEILREYDIVNTCEECTHVTFTGHSLGAAAAIILAFLVVVQFRKEISIEVVLFGCPKLGGELFLEYLQYIEDRNVKIYNYKYRNDLITNLPIGFGYDKIEYIQLNKELGFPKVSDHYIDNYIEELQKEIKK